MSHNSTGKTAVADLPRTCSEGYNKLTSIFTGYAVLAEEVHVHYFNNCTVNVGDQYTRVNNDDDLYKEVHATLTRFLKTIYIKGDAHNNGLVCYVDFILLYGVRSKTITTSFERLKCEGAKHNKAHSSRSKEKRRRRRWMADPILSSINPGDPPEEYERAHLATLQYHKKNDVAEQESCYYTNMFHQLKQFHKYQIVEEWAGKKFGKFDDVIVVTHLVYDNIYQYPGGNTTPATYTPPTHIYKILLWGCASQKEKRVMAIFLFPNTLGSNKSDDTHFLKSKEVLNDLPFFIDTNKYPAIEPEQMDSNKPWKNELAKAAHELYSIEPL